jgi:RHS repeat-associated protein
MPTQTRNIAPIYSCFKSIDLKLTGYPITDKRLLSCMGDTIQSSSANIVSATDYSPFGAPLAGRTYQASEYRFGFNSKEKDDEVIGAGNWQDYGMRMYSPRLGRFPNIDPLTKEYPELTPYQFAGNTSIQAIDLDGLEPAYVKGDGFYTTARDGQLSGQNISREAIQHYSKATQSNTGSSRFSQEATDLILALTPIDDIEAMRTGVDAYGNKTNFVQASFNILTFGMKGKGASGTKINAAYVDDIITQTNKGKGNITGTKTLTENEVLDAGLKWVGKDAKEIGKPGSGVYRSQTKNSDGTTNHFRMDKNSLEGKHPMDKQGTKAPHFHLEKWKDKATEPDVNNHIPFKK